MEGGDSRNTVQYFLQLYIEDTKNREDLRKYAIEVYDWLEKEDNRIGNVFEKSYDYGIFVLNTMQKYWNCAVQSKLIMEAEGTLSSLKSQMKKYEEHERQMANILDSGYRGYD